MEKALPAIPAKRYFTIGEVSELCGVKPYVLRYWEQEFTQLRPMKRRGNRRYYQHHEVLLVRRIRDLLYDQGFTISGARNRLAEAGLGLRHAAAALADGADEGDEPLDEHAQNASAGTADERAAPAADRPPAAASPVSAPSVVTAPADTPPGLAALRAELESISALLQA
jgi:DNA-binding transcriptional MerR regulator